MAERIIDSALLHVIKRWLKAPVIGEDKDGARRHRGGGKANSKGTPQGGVISPLLANGYLHLLDRIWEKHQRRWKLKARIVRYADDFIVRCAGAIDAPLATVRHVLDRLDLTLNETQTRIVDARQESFNFVGFAIRGSKRWTSGKRYPQVSPAPKPLAKIKARMKQQTDRRAARLPLAEVIRDMNTSLRGGVGYFHYRNASKVLSKVNTQAEERLRIHVMKRHKVKGRRIGLGRYPGQQLDAK